MIAGPFKTATDFREGFALVTDASGFHVIDGNGKTPFALPASTKTVGLFSNGLSAVTRSNSFAGYIDKTGAWVIQPWFSTAWAFEDGYAQVEFSDGKTKYNAVIDATGKPLWISSGGQATFDKWAGWKIGQPAPGTPAVAAPTPTARSAPARRASGSSRATRASPSAARRRPTARSSSAAA